MSPFRVGEVAHGSVDYRSSVELRRRVLRVPLGLDFRESELAGECVDRHLVAVGDDGAVVGCLVLGGVDGRVVKMRQVAVEPEFQGKGIGKALVEFSEVVAVDAGFSEMVLHAREVARAFYERLGYAVEGDDFLEVGIRHWKMRKRLG